MRSPYILWTGEDALIYLSVLRSSLRDLGGRRRRETKRKSPSFLSFWFGFVVASFGPRGGAHRFYKNPIFAAFSAVEIDRFPDLRLRVLAVRSEAQQSEHAASRESIREKILLGATEREQVTAEGKGKGGGGAGDEGCYQL